MAAGYLAITAHNKFTFRLRQGIISAMVVLASMAEFANQADNNRNYLILAVETA
jgi:hypothetical protein